MKKMMMKLLNRSIMALDRKLTVKKEEVNHPAHYNQPGRKECIEEMIEKFGVVAVRHFCLLSAYKYNYRHEMKGGSVDLAKAEWFMKKYAELGGEAVE